MIRSVDWPGIKFTICREAIVTVAYKDGFFPDGSRRYSIGGGTLAAGPDEVVEPEEAIRRVILHYREEVQPQINKNLKADISQDQYNALASLTYQAGNVAMRSIVALFNTVHPTLALIAFGLWGRGNPGLSARRIREMIMGLDGYYGDVSQYKLYRGPPHETQYEWTAFPSAVPNI